MKYLDLFSNIRKRQPTLSLQALQKQWVGWVWPTDYTVCPRVSVQAQYLFVAPGPSTGPSPK